MAAAGIIEPSNSPWAVPVVLVRKKNSSWRFCVDYRRLNRFTRKDSYLLPRIDDALDYITGSSWFRSLDLRSGYWQIELAPEARPKTITLHHWARTVAVPRHAVRALQCNTFEQLMERVLADVPRNHCVVYLDDLLVHANSFNKALSNLHEVFTAIRQAGLWLNPTKCCLLMRETKFPGHVINASVVATDLEKVAAVRDWPTPANASELKSFLGLASYYRRFV